MAGHTRMRTQEALAALAALDRAHYQAWTFARLTDELPTTARPYKSDGVMVLSTHRIHDAHTHHHTEPTTEPITDSDGCEGPQKPQF
ncbi:hypothetical protein Ae717Ps2_6541 [Pseudonocardia sp. Ae717_Ps2]|nr:hypothetical protein Ae717Ps2_6541 [Pseudonocardia sp. Ae717_Ps2]